MRFAAVAVVLALGALTACGDDGRAAPPPSRGSSQGASSAPESAPSAAGDPVTAYRAWLAALREHDAAGACARHAPDLTIELRLEAVLLDRAELGDPCVGFVALLWEQPDRELVPLAVEVTRRTDEEALLAVDFPGTDQTVTMRARLGSWFVLDTSPRGRAGGDPPRWLAGWCDLRVGMTRAELTDVMGPASGAYTVTDGGEPQLYWTRDQYDFRAYLDSDAADSPTLDLVGDYDRLAAPERDRLTCPELR